MTLNVTIDGANVLAILEGRLDTAASVQFARDMDPLFDNADKTIIMDCTRLEFISSSGLRHFLSLRKQTIAQGGKVVIKNVNDAIKQVFTITGFYSLFEFC